jgi:tetratricopeptide (TPR) repeat protein
MQLGKIVKTKSRYRGKMTIAFFITDTNEFYADMEGSSIDSETFQWLSDNRIEIGRKTSFTVTKESPVFNTLLGAECWLTENWFPDRHWHKGSSALDPEIGSTEENYQDCARVAHEINEFAAMGKLDKLLSIETDHSYMCQVGVWYWSIGHKQLALMAYKRSIELKPEAATYFNLAVCHDDMNDYEAAKHAITGFYKLVSSDDERENAEEMLKQHGKDHLIR